MLLSLNDYPMPQILTEIPEIRVCYEIAVQMVNLFISDARNLIKELDTDEASEEGIVRKEKAYKIKVFSDDTLEERRLRIKTKENFLDVLNFDNLVKAVSGISDGYATVSKAEGRSIDVKVGIASLKKFDDLKKFIKDFIPVWMTVNIEQIYRTFASFSDKTFEEVSGKTFEELREEVHQ